MLTESAKHALDKIITTVGDLPAVPAVMNSAMGLTSDLQAKIPEISKVLSCDQSITAKILKISNTPFYGRIKEVKTIPEAVMTLGFKTLRSIIIATSTRFLIGKGDNSEMASKLWRHSLSTAIAARQIAEYLRHNEKEEIYIAALLHDIGKLVLLLKLPDWYQNIIDEVEKDSSAFIDVESRVLNFDHTDVAALLLREWAFPQSLIESIVEHHRLPTLIRGDIIPISYFINLANHMSKNIDVGFADQRITDLTSLQSAKAMALNEKTLDLISKEFQTYYQSEVRIFEEN
jgi:putative nucleotidyltransferase with HDIG domain